MSVLLSDWFNVRLLVLKVTQFLAFINTAQINENSGVNNQIWHQSKRWSSGHRDCTNLMTPCRKGTVPYCDLLVDKHAELFPRALFFAPLSVFLCCSLCLFLEIHCWTHRFSVRNVFGGGHFSHIFSMVCIFLSLRLRYFPLPFLHIPFFISPLSHFSSGFLQYSLLEQNQRSQMWGEKREMGGDEGRRVRHNRARKPLKGSVTHTLLSFFPSV